MTKWAICKDNKVIRIVGLLDLVDFLLNGRTKEESFFSFSVMNPIKLRSGTQDEIICQEVLEQNEYRLPDKFEREDVIVDIGAHIGAFAVACLERGAGRVYCYEPDLKNFELLVNNTAPYGNRCFCYNCAVWDTDEKPISFRSGGIEGTAMGDVYVGSENPVKCITMRQLLFNLDGDIRLLKIDAEGAEYRILNGMDLKDVQEIIGEWHAKSGLPMNAFKKWFEEKIRPVEMVPDRHSPEKIALFFSK